MNRSLEIARLEAQIAKDWDTYQKRPRRQFVGASTREYRFARYIDDWRLKVERIGNYGLKDGIVFDFLSNTTPTGGEDLTILRQLLRVVG